MFWVMWQALTNQNALFQTYFDFYNEIASYKIKFIYSFPLKRQKEAGNGH